MAGTFLNFKVAGIGLHFNDAAGQEIFGGDYLIADDQHVVLPLVEQHFHFLANGKQYVGVVEDVQHTYALDNQGIVTSVVVRCKNSHALNWP